MADFPITLPSPPLQIGAWPVMVGLVPLWHVTSFVLTEGYTKVAVAGSSFTQLVRPSAKKIVIKAELIGPWRALRPALEAMALTSRGLAAASAPLMALAGVPVTTRHTVALDMQITQLVFTQNNEHRDSLSVEISLDHAPRSEAAAAFELGADVALAIEMPLIDQFT